MCGKSVTVSSEEMEALSTLIEVADDNVQIDWQNGEMELRDYTQWAKRLYLVRKLLERRR